MVNKSTKLVSVFLAVLVMAFAAYAYWIIDAVPVDNGSCFDTDNGLNFTVRGDISFAMNGTNFTFRDACADNFTLYEFACSEKVPEFIAQNVTDWAVVVGENCTTVSGPNGTCSSGRCA